MSANNAVCHEHTSDPQSPVVVVPDQFVFLTWQCRECQKLSVVNPDFVHDCGIPLCDCAGDSEDMMYVGVSISLDAVKNFR